MRNTNSVLAHEAITTRHNQMRVLIDTRRPASRGSSPSDDPSAVAGITHSSPGLRALKQHQRHLGAAQSRLGLEDSVLSQLAVALGRAKELGFSQASDTASESTRLTTKADVDSLVDFVKSLANMQLAGSYVFGGQYADSAPYSGGAMDPAKPLTGGPRVEVSIGRFVDTNHTAWEMFVATDAVDGIRALSQALGDDDLSGIRAALSRLGGALKSVQRVVGDLGTRMSQLDGAMANLHALEEKVRPSPLA